MPRQITWDKAHEVNYDQDIKVLEDLRHRAEELGL